MKLPTFPVRFSRSAKSPGVAIGEARDSAGARVASQRRDLVSILWRRKVDVTVA